MNCQEGEVMYCFLEGMLSKGAKTTRKRNKTEKHKEGDEKQTNK